MVLESCVLQGKIKKVIFASSSEVYGEPLVNPINEEAITQGKTVYAVSKLAGEELIKAFNQEFPSLSYSILRYFNTYGPFQVSQFVLSRFIHGVMLDKSPVVFGDGSQKRSYNYSSDSARATADAMFSEEADGRILNIGNSTEPITLIDLANKIIQVSGKDASLDVIVKNTFDDTDRDKNREIFQRYCDTSLAKSLIGYEPKVSLDEGIHKILDIGVFQSTWPSSEKNYLID